MRALFAAFAASLLVTFPLAAQPATQIAQAEQGLRGMEKAEQMKDKAEARREIAKDEAEARRENAKDKAEARRESAKDKKEAAKEARETAKEARKEQRGDKKGRGE